MDPRRRGRGEGRRATPSMDAICAALELRSGRIRRPPPELGETPPHSPAGPGTAAASRLARPLLLRSEVSVRSGGARAVGEHGVRARCLRAASAAS